ncbi:hypothetical protein AB0M48_38970 [Lentzea sp. NPDC051208]|uniref:hypothetical protein n=1 Tax=Lentzea sp. NPDC051208 TaxID=3154642 RepID=UPI0034135103
MRRLLLASAAVLTIAAAMLVTTPQGARAADGDAYTEYLSAHPVPDEYGDGEAPVVSGDGWHVAFSSVAELDPLDQTEDTADIYVHDRARHKIVLISQLPGGVDPALVQASQPSISATGRYVAFRTTSPRMGGAQDPDAEAGEGGEYVADVYVCDRDPDGDGDFDEVLPDGRRDYAYAYAGVKTANDGVRSVSSTPVISADGSSVAWEHRPDGDSIVSANVGVQVTRLGFGPNGRLLPARLATRQVAPAPGSGITRARQPVISADGDYVGVLTDWTDRTSAGRFVGIVPGDRAPRREDVLGVDGNGAVMTTVDPHLAMSNDARVVAFQYDVFFVRLVDRDPDGDNVLWPSPSEPFTSELASDQKRAGEANSWGNEPALSGDGRILTFIAPGVTAEGRIPDCSVPETCPPNSTTMCGNGNCQVLARDVVVDRARAQAGQPPLSAHVVTQALDQQCAVSATSWPTGPCMGNDESYSVSLSADGGVIVFTSEANNLADGDLNSWSDVYARLLTPGMAGQSPSFAPVRPDSESTSVVRLGYGDGFGPAHITSVSVTGADSDQFSIHPADTCQGRTFYPGDSCSVSVRFRPAGSPSGVRSAQLVVNVRGRAAPVVVPLEAVVGRPLVGPVLAVGSLDVSFGQRSIMASSADTPVQVTNRGDTAMTVSTAEIVSVSGAVPATALDYRIVSDTCSGAVLAPGDNCVITLAHAPRAAGERPAALLVTGAGGQSQLVLLNGSGIAPRVVVSPSVASPSRPTMVSGTGFAPGQRVEVTSPGHLERATATARSDGGFTATLLLFSGTTPGPRTILARSLGPDTSAQAETNLLVTSGRMAPPGFVWRR